MGFSDIFDYLPFSVAGSPTHPAQFASVGKDAPFPARGAFLGVGKRDDFGKSRQ